MSLDNRLETIELYHKLFEKVERVCSNSELVAGSDELSIPIAREVIDALVSFVRMQQELIVQNFEHDLEVQDLIKETIDSIKK